MKHNELQIVTLKNRDPDILDHLFQIMCYKTIQNFEVICKKFRKENKIIAPPYHIKKTKIEACVIQ